MYYEWTERPVMTLDTTLSKSKLKLKVFVEQVDVSWSLRPVRHLLFTCGEKLPGYSKDVRSLRYDLSVVEKRSITYNDTRYFIFDAE